MYKRNKIKFEISPNNQGGFTLIELLITISIIGILSLLSLFALQGVRSSSRDSQRKNDLATIRAQLELYKSDCDAYPNSSTNQFPTAGGTLSGNGLTTSCSVDNVYILARPKDPLENQDYYYSGSGNNYVLCASLETGGTDICPGTCGSKTCNYKTINP